MVLRRSKSGTAPHTFYLERWLSMHRSTNSVPISQTTLLMAACASLLSASCASSFEEMSQHTPANNPSSTKSDDLTPHAANLEQPTLLAEVDSRIKSLAADETHVYVLTGRAVWRIPADGGEAVELSATGGDVLAIDETHIYWATQIGADIYRIAKTGGEPQLLADQEPTISSIAVHGRFVYFVDHDGLPIHGGGPGTIRRVAKDGSDTPVDVGYTGFGRALAVNTHGVFLSDEPGLVTFSSDGRSDVVAGPFTFFNDFVGETQNDSAITATSAGDTIYLALANASQIVAVDGGSGQANILASGGAPWTITATESSVYWTEVQGTVVKGVPRAGGDVFILVEGDGPRMRNIAANSKYVFVDGDARQVLRVRAIDNGSDPTPPPPGNACPCNCDCAVDTASVCDGGEIVNPANECAVDCVTAFLLRVSETGDTSCPAE